MEVLTSLFQWSDQIPGDSTSLEVNWWSSQPLDTTVKNAVSPAQSDLLGSFPNPSCLDHSSLIYAHYPHY